MRVSLRNELIWTLTGPWRLGLGAAVARPLVRHLVLAVLPAVHDHREAAYPKHGEARLGVHGGAAVGDHDQGHCLREDCHGDHRQLPAREVRQEREVEADLLPEVLLDVVDGHVGGVV